MITGGAGFIGSHLAERLRADGHRLLLVDDLSTGRLANVEPLLGDGCRFVEASAGEAVQEHELMRGVTRVFHLAAAVGVRLVVDDPAGMIRNNVDETDAVLRAAGEAGASVLITSSSEVYGKCPVLPLREDMDLVYGPTSASRWSYGLSKALDEHLALDLARRIGLRSVVVRLFNTIGPRQVGRYGMVVPRFVAAAAAGDDLTVYGDGEQTRAFCDVRDVVDALARLIDHPDAYGRVYNVGSTRQVSVNALADRVIALTAEAGGPVAATRHVSYEAAYGEGFEDTPHRLPDVSRLDDAIGFEPRYTLDDTLRELIERRLRGAERPPAAPPSGTGTGTVNAAPAPTAGGDA